MTALVILCILIWREWTRPRRAKPLSLLDALDGIADDIRDNERAKHAAELAERDALINRLLEERDAMKAQKTEHDIGLSRMLAAIEGASL